MTTRHDPFSHPVNALVLETFQLNGALVAIGDALTAPLGLSTARWQVLGAVAAEDEPTVSRIARKMGLARQSVQRVVDDLQRTGLVALEDNPHHRRARLVRFTPEGRTRFEEATMRWQPIAERLAAAVAGDALDAATMLLRNIRRGIEAITDEGLPP